MLGVLPGAFTAFSRSIVEDAETMLPIPLFASGLQSSPSDIMAVGDSNTWSVGAQAVTPILEGHVYRWRPTGDRVLTMLADHARADRLVFLDSGAFSAFTSSKRNQRPIPEIPWHLVIKVYTHLLKDIPPANRTMVRLVAPDVVGDVQATHRLWRRYQLRLEQIARQGVGIIFPLQRTTCGLLGDLINQARESWSIAASIAGHRAIAGIPYSKCAWTLDEVQDLLRSERIPDVHLLGVGSPQKICSICSFLEQTLPAAHFPMLAADAAVIRSMVGTEAHPTPVRKRIAVRTYTIASEQVTPDQPEEDIYEHLAASRALARREVLAEALRLPIATYGDLDPIAYRATLEEAQMALLAA
jgi:hypothetical protein